MIGIVAAAGAGRRFGAREPKQLVEIAGRSILDWSVERLATVCDRVVVAVPPSHLETMEEHFSRLDVVTCVAGGATRWQSVRRAYETTVGADTDLIAIHDGARPAVALEDLQAVVAAARTSSAAVLGRPVDDTVKRVRGDRIEATLDREELFRAETPQVFSRSVFDRAVELASVEGLDPTDESSLAERLAGIEVTAVTARHPNPKLTRQSDLLLVERLLRASESGAS